MQPSDLHVLTCIFNPYRYKSRVNQFEVWKQQMQQAGVTLWVIELQVGDRPFVCTDPNNRRDVQVRSDYILWHKENLLNLLLQRLPESAEYVAFIDADVQFVRPDWAVETIQQLQIHNVVQMWQECDDLGPDGQTIERHLSYMYLYYNGIPMQKKGTKYAAFGHPGYAWAYRMDAISQLGAMAGGPLLDQAILGAADHHMAAGLVGQAVQTVPGNITQAYYDMVMAWQDCAVKALSKDVGYLPTKINHYFGGKKKNRFYVERWGVLISNDYVPWLDLRREPTGVYALTDRNLKLRDDIRKYFQSRNEDSIDL